MKQDGTCLQGRISKVDAKAVTIQSYQTEPVTIQCAELARVWQGDALLFTAVGSWYFVMHAHVLPHEAFVLKTHDGRVVKGIPLKVTADDITLKHGAITTDYKKAEILTVDYLRVRPATDTWDYFDTEAPELLFFLPETYYRLMGLEGRIPVRLYNANLPGPDPAPECSPADQPRRPH